MDDLQLNISIPRKEKKKVAPSKQNASEYKFLSKPGFTGKTIARKRPQILSKKSIVSVKSDGEPREKVAKRAHSPPKKHGDLSTNLRDLSENKGKFLGKNYQELSDDIQVKQKPRTGGWISSLFKNNPDVPRVGQRAVKPIVEKVFSVETFADLDIHPHSVANLQQNLGMKKIMTVQQSAIPVILQGRDVLIRSQTGSGKTLAYALPVVEGLQAIRPKINRHDGIRVVIVVPTRELAVQTYELFVKLVKPFTWVVPGLLSGGQKRKAEKARLRKGLSILVGTPGRINDHLRHTKSLNFSKTNVLVLDEADRLLDMGYEKDVAAIVKAIEEHKKAATYDPMAMMKQTMRKKFDDDVGGHSEEDKKEVKEETDIKHHLTEIMLSKERLTILLSATLSKAVENLAGITLADPVFIDTSEGRALVADSLKPHQEMVTKDAKKKDEKEVYKEQDPLLRKKRNEAIAEESIVNEENIEIKERRGLKEFSGLINSDLFDTDNVKNKTDDNKLKRVIDANTTEEKSGEESDSDSDYEYFKVQKELENKNKIVEDTNAEELQSAAAGNTFVDAVKSAIIEDELVLPASVNQTFLVVPMKLRLVTLCSSIVEHCILNKRGGKMIVFMATLEMVDYHADLIESVLTGNDVKVKKDKGKKETKPKNRNNDEGSDDEPESSSDSEMEIDYEAPSEGGIVPVEIDMFKLHGSMPHEQRMEVFKQFRKAKSGVLICTDVAARGIDVPRVDLVLQYCAPASATDYVHRVGRTGRAAQVGAAVMFLLPSEVEFVRHLEQKRIRLRQQDESKALEALRTVAPAAANAARSAIAVQTRLEHVAHSHRDWLARASRAYTSWVRFYSGYPRDVRPYLDAKQLHLGHAAKAFALRDTPAALARRAKQDAGLKKERPTNRLTVHEEEDKKRPGFAKMKAGAFKGRVTNKQSSMHTASEFDSGLPPLDHHATKKKKKKLK